MAKQYPNWLGELPPGIKGKAFLRSDAYGVYAGNPLPLPTKLRLWLALVTLVPLKLLACLLCVLTYYVLVLIGDALLAEPLHGRYMVCWGMATTRALLWCLGFWRIKWVYVAPDGSESSSPPPPQPDAPRFGCYVSNHCSWVDIILYMSRVFPSFVAKIEVSRLPLVGPISRAMQCMYVDREARLAAASGGQAQEQQKKQPEGDAGQGMAQLVKARMLATLAGEQRPMLLFPEGTTTNNGALIPFKRGAFIAGVPVQPCVVKYDTSGRFSPCWDAMPGPKHILLLMTELRFRVTVYQLPLYTPSPEERADAALYAANVRAYMSKFSGIPTSEDTFADKLVLFKYIVGKLKEQQQARRGGGKGASGGAGAGGSGKDAAAADGGGAGGAVAVTAEAVAGPDAPDAGAPERLRQRRPAAGASGLVQG